MTTLLGYCQCSLFSLRYGRGPTSRLLLNFIYDKVNDSSSCNFSTQSSSYQRVRKKRDRYTVLKALSSTVSPGLIKPLDHRIIDDHVLRLDLPGYQNAIFEAIDAGEKAAEYFIKEHKDLLPMRKPFPEWGVSVSCEDSVENLRKLLVDGKPIKHGDRIIEMYQKLKEDGLDCIDVDNEVLGYAAYHALPNGTWLEGNVAEALFEELADRKTSETYQEMILGLLKYDNNEKAFQIYTEMKEQNLSGSLFFFNTLLSKFSVMEGDPESKWEFLQNIVSHMRSCKIKPNISTFNWIMSVALEHKDSFDICLQLIREMKHLGITPSLGSYYYLLEAEYKAYLTNRTGNNDFVLPDVMKDINGGKVTLDDTHPSDKLFFDLAMKIAKFIVPKNKNNIHEQIRDVVEQNNLHDYCTFRSFYSNYLLCVLRHYKKPDEFETIYEIYKEIISFVVPAPWVYIAFIRKMALWKNPTYLPELYRDSRKFRMRFTEDTFHDIFTALKENIPVEKVTDISQVIEDVEFVMEDVITHSASTLDTCLNVYLLAKRFDKVLEKVDQSIELRITLPNQTLTDTLKLVSTEGDKIKILGMLRKEEMSEEMIESVRNIIVENSSFNENDDLIKQWL